MPTYYVSKSTANGYVVGNDSNNGTSISTPKLTIANAAITTASDGDTVIINDGTYAETLTLTKAVTILPVTDYGVTITGTGTPSNVVVTSDADGGTFTFGKIIIDGEALSATSAALQLGVSTNTLHNVVLNGTRIIGAAQYAIRDLLSVGNVTATGAEILKTTGSSAFYGYNTSLVRLSGTTTFTDCTFNLVGDNATFYTIHALPHSTTGGGGTMTLVMDGNTITHTNNSATLTFNYVMRIWNVNVFDTHHNTITANAPNAAGPSNDSTNIIFCQAYTNTPTYEAHTMTGNIYENTIYHNGTGGIVITAGGDGYIANEAGVMTDVDIYNNRVYGSSINTDLHGIIQGQQNGGRIYGNYVENIPLALMFKGQDGGVMSGNIVVNTNGIGGQYASLRIKGSRNSVVTNNTVINLASPTYVSAIGDMYQEDEAGARYGNSTGIVWSNNIIYNAGATARPARTQNSSQTATFSNNNYYMPSASSITYTYGGTDRTSFSAWQSNVEATARNVDIQITSGAHFKDGSVLAKFGRFPFSRTPNGLLYLTLYRRVGGADPGELIYKI
jgi:hypothetical protein